MYENINKYWRAANYLTLAHIYLKKNALLKHSLALSDIKTHYSGHWGTSPGINFIYAHLNNVITKYQCKMQLVIGPGHAGSALLSNLYLEGSLQKWYKNLTEDEAGIEAFINIEKRIKGMRSEINPFYPGTIYDGGELGYSYAVAAGSIMDNKERITVTIIGDGEAETGSLSSAWNAIHCIGKRRGHILPILHLNGFKMGGRSLLSYKSDNELVSMFQGFGYSVRIVEINHNQMEDALEWTMSMFKECRDIEKNINPLIILRSPKGLSAPADDIISIVGKVKSHKIPVNDIFENSHSFQYLERWLLSYKINEIFDENGRILDEVKKIIPKDEYKLGAVEYTQQKLSYPNIEEIALKSNGHRYKSILILNDYLSRTIEMNKLCFRIMSPDELTSNQLDSLTKYNDNVTEILNENICQGWMQGYNMTGRHSMMISYEAFMPVITSMISQFAKYLIQLDNVEWRKFRPSMIYILTSTCWENTYSHQNPELINSLIIQKNSNTKVYFPIDANTLLVCTEISLKSDGKINIIITSKHEMTQNFLLEEAKQAVTLGYYVWNKEIENPDVILVSIGDYSLIEMKQAIAMFDEFFTPFKYRLVSIIQLTCLCSWNKEYTMDELTFMQIFSEKEPVIVLFHGYPLLINAILADRFTNRNLIVMGYQNKSIQSANVLCKMIMNECSRFHILLRINELLYNKRIIEEKKYIKNIEKLNNLKDEKLS